MIPIFSLLFSFILLSTLNIFSGIFFNVKNLNLDNTEKSAIINNDINSGNEFYYHDKLNQTKTLDFDLENSIGVIFDFDNDKFVFEKNATKVVQIASITKLMTALVFLDNNPGWDYVYKIQKEDRRNGGKIFLYWGEEVKIKDIFHTSLMASANTATMALVDSTGLTENEFVEKMNQKAVKLGLLDTYFEDPVGLSDNNVSTARDVAKLANEAFKNRYIAQVIKTKKYKFFASNRLKSIESTNKLLNIVDNDVKNIEGKTGYIELAGYCFVGKFIKNDKEIISVILGAKSSEQRFSQAMELSKAYLGKKREVGVE